METFSYPDSVNSSPRSREIELENSSWDESINSYKVKFMCSYGGKIHPRPHDNHLTYTGGDTKILAVDRNIKFSTFISKLSSLSDASEVCFKYQLPGEDLDALISVTNDEDLDHMMLEYDRLHRSSAKPARLRLFVFPLNTNPPESASSFGSDDSKSARQWFVDALNAVQINQNLEGSSNPPSGAATTVEEERTRNPDFLFGLEKGRSEPARFQDPSLSGAPTMMVGKEFHATSEERHVIGEPVVPSAEIQRQIQELQRMQISSQEQAVYNTTRKFDDYYQQNAPPPAQPQRVMPMTNPPAYWQERNEHYQSGPNEPQMYLIQTPSGVYQAPAMRPVTGQVNQAYYGVQRMVPDVYREQPVYNAVGPPVSSSTMIQQQPKTTGAYTSEGIGLVRPPVTAEAGGYAQFSYDGAGRQMFYATPGGMMHAPPPYQAVTQLAGGMDGRQAGGGALNPDGKIVGKPSQTS